MILKIKNKLSSIISNKWDKNKYNNDFKGDERLLAFYRQFIHPGDLCFDIGANIGERTDIWLQLGARVVCVEPQVSCVKILYKKYASNSNVEIIQAGLDSKPGIMTLSICEEANTLSTFSEKWKTGRFNSYNWVHQYDVQMKTLDELVALYGVPSFLKIDVEGFELNVLKGLSTPIHTLSFEFTKEFIIDAKACAKYLEMLGKVSFNYALGDNLMDKLHFGLSDWGNNQELFDALEHEALQLLWGDIYARFLE